MRQLYSISEVSNLAFQHHLYLEIGIDINVGDRVVISPKYFPYAYDFIMDMEDYLDRIAVVKQKWIDRYDQIYCYKLDIDYEDCNWYNDCLCKIE